MTFQFLSLASGIEAASVAWGPLGWKAVAFSEIDPFACALLKHHYPDVPNWGDMTKYEDWPYVAADLLCGGTPCQSYSVAGLRRGLDDPRGNLMLTFGAIAAKYRPRWLVWENVVGVLSSAQGRDFAEFLGLLTGQRVEVPAGGWQNSGIVSGIPDAYGVAYRVLDAQYFGVPQRRRRVFVVGCLGDWRPAAAVLFERHSMSGHLAPRRQTGQDVAAGTLRSTDGGSDVDHARAAQLIAGTLQSSGKPAGSATQQDAEAGLLIAHALRGSGFDASEDGTGRGTPIVASTLTARASKGVDSDCTTTLLALPFDTTQITSRANGSSPKAGDPSHPLAASAHAPAIAFDCKTSGQHGFGCGVEIAGTQRAMSHAAKRPNGGGHQAVVTTLAIRGRGDSHELETRSEGTANAQPTPNGGRSGIGLGATHYCTQVRRLTPRECERLQSFPDDYTRVPSWKGWRKMDAAETPAQCIAAGLLVRQNKTTGQWRVRDVDGPRYKSLGNSWCVNNVRWIGCRIQRFEHQQGRRHE